MLKLKILVLMLSFIGGSFSAFSQDKQYVDMGAQIIKVGEKNLLAVSFSNTKDWHTYWKNPGDAGLEIKLKFSESGNKITLSDYPWPTPKRYIEQGNMWAFGYSNKYALFYDIDKSLAGKKLKIVGEWLVCKDICIPGTRTVELNIDTNLKGQVNSHLSDSNLSNIFRTLPAKGSSNLINIYLTKGQKENQLALHYMIEDVDFSKINTKANILTPYLAPPFDYKHEEVYLDRKNKILYGRMYVDWDGIYEDPVWDLPKDGFFQKALTTKFILQYPKDKPGVILTQNFKEFSLKGDKALSATFAKLEKLGSKKVEIPKKDEKGILFYIVFAFLGGLILNLMPCVLPVISLKLFGLIVHSNEEKKQVLKHNLAYTAGVLASFITLGIVVLVLKTSGEQIGWGFQLQSPLFVFFMLMMIFIMSLNMLGLFEFVTPGGKTLGNAEMKKGVSADFVNGILATILSTPCSAPFLGTALTFAFTTSNLNIFVIFIAVGLGLAFPFILTGFFPKLIKFFPKPGLWMDKLKKILGLSLILTAVWLYDVLSGLIDMDFAGIYINTIITMTFFAFYFRKHVSKKLIYNILVFLIPLALFGKTLKDDSYQVVDKSKSEVKEGSLTWEKWSPEKMQEQKNLGKVTFIDFTARWCLTCKVNKKLVLNSDDFKDVVEKNNITVLQGDWTKRDETITKFLRKYDIVGVPAYFIQKADGEIISLGETISVDKVKKHL